MCLLCQICGTSPTSVQTQAAAVLAGVPLDPLCRSPPTSPCSLYFCRWTMGNEGGGGVGRGQAGAPGSGPQLGWAGQPPLPLSPAMGPSQMGRCTLILPQGDSIASPSPPPNAACSTPLPPIAILYLASVGAWPVTYKVQPRSHPQLWGLHGPYFYTRLIKMFAKDLRLLRSPITLQPVLLSKCFTCTSSS